MPTSENSPPTPVSGAVTGPVSAAPSAKKKRAGGRPRGSKSRSTLERELRELRGQVASAKQRAVEDPFAAPVRNSPPKSETPLAETPPAPATETPGTAPETSEAVSETPVSGEPGVLGIEGARAIAPAYYGAINAATKFILKRAPKYKANPAEAARLAKAVALDARGQYVKGELVDASDDRRAIDPPLIIVLAKQKLTPEWALVITTAFILAGKFAVATGDPELLEILSATRAAA